MSRQPAQRILAVGQFPPPVNGFTLISQAVVEALRQRAEVTVFNTATRPGAGRLVHYARRAGRLALAVAGLLRARLRGRSSLYLPCEGDAGLALTLVLVATGRLLGMPITLHHHSFGYLQAHSRLMARIVRLGGQPLRHVFLCPCMQSDFERAYGRVPAFHVQSNAVFVPPQAAPPRSQERPPLVLGHLSNLCREKGLHTFLQLFDEARSRGLPVRAVLAGPAAQADDRAAIADAAARHAGSFRYLGAVAGTSKADFYREVDVFLFPTEYANEAQPVVLFEACAAGVLVASNRRGCIASQLGPEALVVDDPRRFIPRTLAWLEDLLRAPERLPARQSAVARAYGDTHAAAAEQLQALAALLGSARPVAAALESAA